MIPRLIQPVRCALLQVAAILPPAHSSNDKAARPLAHRATKTRDKTLVLVPAKPTRKALIDERWREANQHRMDQCIGIFACYELQQIAVSQRQIVLRGEQRNRLRLFLALLPKRLQRERLPRRVIPLVDVGDVEMPLQAAGDMLPFFIGFACAGFFGCGSWP